MLLDRIDIDAHGPLSRVEIGPLAEHMNVIFGPEGSGKTAIARFIRDSLVHRRYPLGMLSSSTGRVVWADRNGKVHCRREQDGTKEGRRTIEFESRGDQSASVHSLEHSWLNAITDSGAASRAAGSIQLPESIVDCVITDTAVTNVARVVWACVRNGLDSGETYRSLPIAEDRQYLDREGSVHDHSQNMDHSERHRALRAQLADVDAELARIQSGGDVPSLMARREELNARLAHRPEGFFRHASADGDRHRKLDVYIERAETLRRRQNELRRWIAELDAELARVRTSFHTPFQLGDRSYCDYRETVYRSHANHVDDSLRRRLDDLDTQVIRWRRMLMEVRGLRDMIFREHGQMAYGPTSIDNIARRRQRLDGFLNMIDRYDRDRAQRDDTWTQYYNDANSSYRTADDIESRIDAATRQIDWLLQRYRDGGLYFDWYQSAPLTTSYRSATTLSEMLQSIRRDLHQIVEATRRQHHSHWQTQKELSADVARSQHERGKTVAELSELHQSEQWLVASIEQLSKHRESLLRDFALHTTSASPQATSVSAPWDIHLWDAAGYAKERAQRVSELDHISAQLNTCLDQAAELRRAIHRYDHRDLRPDNGQATYDEDLTGGSRHRSWVDDDAIRHELRHIDELLAMHGRATSLHMRREELLNQLQAVRSAPRSLSPLAEDASRWLIRLSAGRLRRIEWNHAAFRSFGGNGDRRSVHAQDANGARLSGESGVRIDGQDEVNCSAADRALGSLAVRLAAGDLLARTGRAIPLVIETWRELLVDTLSQDRQSSIESNPYSLRGFDHQYYGTPLAFYQHGDDRNRNHPIAAALYDYSRSGRQVVVLTSDISLSDQIHRAGGRRFDLVSEQTTQPYRPIWRSNYESQNYVGPYPYAHGDETDSESRFRATATSYPSDVNRYFDVAWREAYGIYDNPDSFVAGSPRTKLDRVQTDWAVDGVDHRDGYFYAETYTTIPRDRHGNAGQTVFNGAAESNRFVKTEKPFVKPESPFFLTVDSSIDQAPSIDAIAASRLRGLSVSHINHLMQQDPNRLSDALGLTNVDAATVRRWQNECRLVCRVPQLRGFDARILVGCDVTDPRQLAAIAPTDLLDRVKRFLSTERGQRILLSGSSYELSRITSWIAAANSNNGFKRRANEERVGFRKYTTIEANQARDAFDSERYEYESPSVVNANRYRGRRNRIRTAGEINRDLNEIEADETGYSTRDGISYRDRSIRSTRGGSSRERRGNREIEIDLDGDTRDRRTTRHNVRIAEDRAAEQYRDVDSECDDDSLRESRGEYNRGTDRASRSERGTSNSSSSRNSGDSRGEGQGRRSRKSRSRSRSDQSASSVSRSSRSGYSGSTERGTELRFYLQRDSDVVDAPSIGPRLAERLNAIGIYSVNDLLQANAEETAVELADGRVDADMIVAWQQQAALVCRVPMLRGHDAQLLVAADVTTPEELVTYSADDLFALIDPISHSSDGKRILRGGSLPDLNEITEWLHYGQYHRELMAA